MDRATAHRTRSQAEDQWRSTVQGDDLLTLTQAAALVRVTYGTAWSWWHHGRLTPAGTRQNRPLFRASEVRTTEAAVRATGRGRPRLVALAAYL